ncbi:alanine racemase [Periweissella cryptocerci]|uniref:Alanine racemase n=1 Tax=Periweissella cryptocerci TaxID=2506420 RepID=A0A4P6YW68_9LACO|nr:alanine racemase [Periweissella cryptocerci]QBO37050.1 alanine racemase [Periweissella cryptocerci]
MVVASLRPSRIEISQAAFNQNIRTTMQTSHAKHMFLAVKANGYGHGILEIAHAAVNAGVYGLAVAVADEAVVLRQNGITIPIMVLGYTEPQYAEILAQHDIIASVVSADWLTDALDFLTGNHALQVSISLDTGMNRIGMRTKNELHRAIDMIKAHPNMYEWLGLMTHFATADSTDEAYFEKQLARWHDLTDDLAELPPMVHVANSGAAMYHADEVPTDFIRVGTVAYGWEPSGKELATGEGLAPILSIKSALSFVKQLDGDEGISYGRTYETDCQQWIGTIPLGYGDGIDRNMQGFEILVGNEKAKIVGQIAMDQLMVRLPHEMPVGTEVTLVGSNGQQSIDIWDVTKYVGSQPWEFTNRLTERLPRFLVD